MSAVDLLEPILGDGLQRNNFFNGRLLSAEDLSAEQRANRMQQARLARSLGDGIGWGLGVTLLSTKPSILTVRRGLAINRVGNVLALPADAEVTLVPSTQPATPGTGVFAACEPPRPGASTVGIGAYVFAIAPASGYSGSALVSDQNMTTAGQGACGARFSVEGVRFRLVPIPLGDLTTLAPSLRTDAIALLPPPAGDVPKRELLRNLLAHLCLGTSSLDDFFADPRDEVAGVTRWSGWGAIDALRDRGDLTDCDVPLAVVVLTAAGISFVDVWSVRRKLVDASAIHVWRPVAGPRRVAEGESAFLQFQAQLESIAASVANPGSVAASVYFRFLPAAGWLPTRAAFDWKTFLQQHAPPAETPVDAALLRGIVEQSWLDEPFALATTPPVPVRVYRVPDASFVVFARSRRGNIRVTLSPSPAPPSVQVSATSDRGHTTRAAAPTGAVFPVVELAPGPYTVDASATNFVSGQATDVLVVGGRTVDVAIAVTPLPNGSILVDPIDRATNQRITTKVTSVTATAGAVTKAGTRGSDGRWQIDDLPAAAYRIDGVAGGYKSASVTMSTPTAPGTQINATLLFDPETAPRQKPPKCITVPKVTRPPLGKTILCMVLEATEFEESYFFHHIARIADITTGAGDEFRIKERYEEAKQRHDGRYVASTGELLFTKLPWKGMDILTPETEELKKWLVDWREWLADQLSDEQLRTQTPHVYIDPRYTPPASPKQVPELPSAYAVFASFLGVPLRIQVADKATKAPVLIEDAKLPGVQKAIEKKLFDHEIRYLDDLAGGWQEIINDATGGDVDPIYLVTDAQKKADTINANRTYLEGMTTNVLNILTTNNLGDDVALANADIVALGGLLGDEGFASRLVSQAQSIVPRESWSLDSLDLSESGKRSLERAGYKTLGDVSRAQSDPTKKNEVLDALGLADASAQTREATAAALQQDAVTIMTENSVALLPDASILALPSMDRVTAMTMSDAGYATAGDLENEDANTVAAKTGVSVDKAQAFITEAKDASRAGRDATVVATVGSADKTEMNKVFGTSTPTISAILSKSAADLKNAFGSVAAATSVLNGLRAGMSRGSVR